MIKKIKIKELVIWSDNPRYDVPDSNHLSELSEYDLMDMLWEQIGDKEMIALAKSINENGYRESRLPIVVDEGSQLRVYDGNRRITCGKLIALKDSRLRFEDYNITQDTEVTVTIVSRSQALEEMDEIHAGSNAGRVIAWDAYIRDKSLVSRQKPARYPKAYEFVSKINITKKKDFGKTNYTDLQTILSNKKFMDIINDITEDSIEQFQILKEMRLINRKSWSRYLTSFNNDENTQEEFKKKLDDLIQNKADEQLNDESSEADFHFELIENHYYGIARSTINLRKIIKTNLNSQQLESVIFIVSDRQMDIDLSTGITGLTNPPGEYHLYINYDGTQLPFTLTLTAHKREHKYKDRILIDDDFFNKTYDLFDKNYKPIAYLIKFFNSFTIDDINVYAATILYRQFLEFTYKAYITEKNLTVTIENNLASGINQVNNLIRSQNPQSFNSKKSLGAKVQTFVGLIQENAHGIEGISFNDLNQMQKMISKYLVFIIEQINNTNH